MRRRTVSCLVSLAAVLVYGSMAVAGPLPPVGTALGTPTGALLLTTDLCDIARATTTPTPTGVGGGCGESDLAQATKDGLITQVNVDWMVLAPGSYNLAAWAGVFGTTPHPSGTGAGPDSTVGVACPDCFLYLYQEENSSVNAGVVGGVTTGVNMKAMSIFPTIPVKIAGVFGANGDDTYGDLSGGNPFDDLDCGPGNPAYDTAKTCLAGNGYVVPLHPGHYIAALGGNNGVFNLLDDGKVGPFGIQTTNANPAREEEGVCPAGDVFGDMGDPGPAPLAEGAGTCINPADPIETTFESMGVTWTYLPSKPPHHETVTLFFASPVGPVYGSASTQATNATTWATGQTDPDNTGFLGEAVPVPGLQVEAIPEPTTLALFGGGLIALGLLRRKMKR